MKKAAAFFIVLSLSFSVCAEPSMTLLANSIDFELSRGYIENLVQSGIRVSVISASDLQAHRSDPTIVILGGHRSPEGVGEIVTGLLTEDEKKEMLSSPDYAGFYIIPNPWADKQRVIVYAGYGKEQTRKAFSDAQGDLMKSLRFDERLFPENNSVVNAEVPPLDPSQPYTEVNAYQAYAIVRGLPEVIVIDVRGVPYYEAGHIPGAVSMNEREFSGNVDSLDKGKTYLVYCGGNSESIRVGDVMAGKGFTRIYRLVDGYIAWRKAGYPKEVTASSS